MATVLTAVADEPEDEGISCSECSGVIFVGLDGPQICPYSQRAKIESFEVEGEEMVTVFQLPQAA